MNYITSRVTTGLRPVLIKAISDWYKSNHYVYKYIIAQECVEGQDDREHLHIYIETNKKPKNFYQNFKNSFPTLKGNQRIQFKIATSGSGTIEHAENYVCKGYSSKYIESAAKIISYKGYTQDDLINIHNRYWEINKSIKIKKKNKSNGSIISKIIDTLQSHEIDKYDIGMAILKHYDENNKIFPGKFKLRDMINTIDCKIAKGKSKSQKLNFLVAEALN